MVKEIELKQLFDLDNIQEIELSKLKKHPSNPRRQTQKGMELLEKSILEFGNAEPLIATHDYFLLSGHQRLFVLKKLGYKTVKVIFAKEGLTQQQQQKLLLYFNQNSFKDSSNAFDFDALGNWDIDFLKNDVGLTDFDLGLNFENDQENEKEDKNNNESDTSIIFKFDALMYESVSNKIDAIKKENKFKTNEIWLLEALKKF